MSLKFICDALDAEPMVAPEFKRGVRHLLSTKRCRRCGQEMPVDFTPDGCEDLDCPEAK